MKLSIILPTKDRGYVFEETLKCACDAIKDIDAEIIIVNDSKKSFIKLIEPYDNVVTVNNPGSGVASARNLGASIATGDLLLFIDDDILISKESVSKVLSLHEEFSKACFNLNWEYSSKAEEKISGHNFGRFLRTNQLTSFQGWYNDPTWRVNELFPSKSVASFHLSITKNEFERSGGYNEEFPHAGFEDYDFPIRLKKAGLSFYIDSRISVYHNEIDRLGLDNWLKSQERRAVTRKKAVHLGYEELALTYGPLKKITLNFVLKTEFIWKWILNRMPNYSFFDPLYFKLLAIIQASRIYKGYTFG